MWVIRLGRANKTKIPEINELKNIELRCIH